MSPATYGPLASAPQQCRFHGHVDDAALMGGFADSLRAAWVLVLGWDAALAQVVLLSLAVSASACLLAAGVGLAGGAWRAVARFPGRRVLIALLNTLLALPSVVVGLVVYLLLSRSGPLGAWGILFTPQAMVIAQTVLVLPVVAALTRQLIGDAMHGNGGARRHGQGAGRSRRGDDRRRQHRRCDARHDDDDRARDLQR